MSARLMLRGLVVVGTLSACQLTGCKRSAPAGQTGTVPESEVVARVDGQPITRAELEQRLADRGAFVRARYGAPEKRKELLDSVVRFEVLAHEAQSRGYGRDPDVVRHEQQLAIDRMIAAEMAADKAGGDAISREQLEQIYRAHPGDYTEPEAIRFDQIVVADPARARQVATAARALGARDAGGFRRLVAAHSEDEDSRARGGDSTFLERGSKDAPPAVLEAAFAQPVAGRIVGPIASERGHHVLRITARREPALRPFEAVAPLLRARAVEQLRRQRLEAWLAEARSRVKVEVYQDRLDRLAEGQKPLVGDGKP